MNGQTATQQPPAPPARIPVTRPAVVTDVLRHATAHRNSGNIGPRYLQTLLDYVDAVEQQLIGERGKHADFAAQAEGEFHERRLELAAWRRYAVQLEEQRSDLKFQVQELLAAIQDVRNARWWRRRERQLTVASLEACREMAALVQSHDDPTPPAVEAE